MMYLGLDPGKSGAIARVFDHLPPMPSDVVRLKETEHDIAEFLRGCEGVKCFAILERVGAMPKQGVSSTFKFGTSYGFLRGLLVGMRIPFSEVSPAVWQKMMGCRSGGDKNVTKSRAQQLFPTLKIVHATADALLLADYARRTHHAAYGRPPGATQ